MNSRPVRQQGFTIIEAMLFLAITGLMVAGIFTAISGSINRQRYEDTIVSLVDHFQGQFNLVNNVRNNRQANVVCTFGSVQSGSDTGRGTSDCTIIGRLVTSSDGVNYTSHPVYATRDITTIPTEGHTESEYIDRMNLQLADPSVTGEDLETYRLPWGARGYVNGDTNNSAFSLLLIRVPYSGLIRSYSLASSTTNVNVIRANPSSESLRICVDSREFLSGNRATGVRILPLASTVSGVQRIAAGETGPSC